VAELGRVNVLLKQWEWAKRKLTKEEINNEILLVTDNDRKAMRHMATGMKKGDMLREIWVWDKEVVITEEVRNSVFFHLGNMVISFWHSNKELLLEIWSWVRGKQQQRRYRTVISLRQGGKDRLLRGSNLELFQMI
jgi:hypothetical protein